MISMDAIAQSIRAGSGQGTPAMTNVPNISTAGSGDIFGNVFHAAAQGIDKLENDAQSAVSGLLTGNGVEVHDAMIATQKSELTFELALQVRNKAVSAYQQMMQMQF